MGESRVTGLRVRAADGGTTTVPGGLVVRAIGHVGVELPGLLTTR